MAFSSLFRLFLAAVAIAATVAGCGAPGAMRSALPPAASNSAPGGSSPSQESSVDRTVAESHRQVTGSAGYGTIDGEWVAPAPAPGRPGYYVIDGEVVPGPPGASHLPGELAPLETVPDAAAPAATLNCTTFVNYVPPPCTNTGAFRRVYSGPGYSFALAHLTFPSNITTMPKGETPLNGDTGFAYMEGWTVTAPNAGNSEFGFQYSATHNYYTPYIRTANPVGYYILQIGTVAVHYMPTSPVTFAFAGFTIGTANYLHIAVIGTTDISCSDAGQKPTYTCMGHGHVRDVGWTESGCCIMARMTTIGQTNPNNKFYDGVKFGPIAWSGVELARTAPAPAPGSTTLPLTGNQPPWSSAGTQNWPPKLSKVIASGVTGAGETDTIDLKALPALTLSLQPSTCQRVNNTAGVQVKYALSVNGSSQGLTLNYGWTLAQWPGVSNWSLTVPKATYNPLTQMYLGSSKAATINLLGPGPKGPYAGNLSETLFFSDATGTMTSNWNGKRVETSGTVAVGPIACPTPKP